MKSEEPSLAGTKTLTPVEAEVIELFVQYSRAFGQPRSVAEIYGLLFVSPVPLTFNDLQERLDLSTGSTSQGLKFLRELGAVRVVDGHQRRTQYEAVAELRNLANRFVRQEILNHFADSEVRLKKLAVASEAIPGPTGRHFQSRIAMLNSWQRKARLILPLLVRVLGDGKNGK
jgi:DNA-binding transcriptional regulator GbsR (MarR family)